MVENVVEISSQLSALSFQGGKNNYLKVSDSDFMVENVVEISSQLSAISFQGGKNNYLKVSDSDFMVENVVEISSQLSALSYQLSAFKEEKTIISKFQIPILWLRM
ncbi:MAG: hypothetical protein SWX82_16980 [Cyanobacteriota bacterium]|nr:hypothetical protein [Cyanobacteriota bacterium]